ncbi:hypothetical protein V8E53_008307 [Lactarius tabidus]
MSDRDRYIHLKEISVHFIKRRPTSALRLILEDGAGVKQRSDIFKKYNVLHWNLDTYVRAHTMATLTIRQVHLKISLRFAQVSVAFDQDKFSDDGVVSLKDSRHRFTIDFVCGRSQSLANVTRFFGSQTRRDLVSKVPRLLKHPQLAALPPPASDVPYVTIHWLNDDILLGIFNCYRLEEELYWNRRLLWCKLSHVCQRWRHLIYGFTFHLGMYIRCTNGTPVVDTLDHLPPLPLFVDYDYEDVTMTEKDTLGISHALQSHDRVRHIDLRLPPCILHKVLVLMDQHFPILDHLSLSLADENSITLTLPQTFRAPNLRHIALPNISPPGILRFLTSTVSLVSLKLTNIETSSYFRPRVLVARLQSLPQLQRLSIDFSIPIPRPSTERELLGEQRAPVTLPSLKYLRFKGVGAYLESLVAQIGVPHLEQLHITLFNQIAFALPHLHHLIKTTERFKLSKAEVFFNYDGVVVTTDDYNSSMWFDPPLHVRVMCKQLDWQIDCAAQIFHELIPALSSVEQFTFRFHPFQIPTELQNGAIESTTWHELLRPFIGVDQLHIYPGLTEELSRALQVDEVGSDPGFLPNLRSIGAAHNLFTSFIDTRRVVCRPVEFSLRYY